MIMWGAVRASTTVRARATMSAGEYIGNYVGEIEAPLMAGPIHGGNREAVVDGQLQTLSIGRPLIMNEIRILVALGHIR